MQGIVKSFNSGKGYGFITSDGFPSDIFVHVSSVQLPYGEYLRIGQEVVFTLASDKLGRTIAHDVRVTDAAADDGAADQGAPRPYLEIPGRPRQYLRADMTAEFDVASHRRAAAEALFAKD